MLSNDYLNFLSIVGDMLRGQFSFHFGEAKAQTVTLRAVSHILRSAEGSGSSFGALQEENDGYIQKNLDKRKTTWARQPSEKGYTFVEVLIVVAVIAALAVGAFALFTGRGKTTEMSAIAQQVAQTVQSQQQLIFKGLRTGKITSGRGRGIIEFAVGRP